MSKILKSELLGHGGIASQFRHQFLVGRCKNCGFTLKFDCALNPHNHPRMFTEGFSPCIAAHDESMQALFNVIQRFLMILHVLNNLNYI